MATLYRVEPFTGIVVFTDDGVLDYQDWEETFLEALADPEVKRPRRFLSDRRGLTHPISLGTIEQGRQFLERHSMQLQDVRWAMLSRPDSSLASTAQLIEDFVRPTLIHFRAFTDLTKALRWLFPYYDDDEIAKLGDWVDSGAGGRISHADEKQPKDGAHRD